MPAWAGLALSAAWGLATFLQLGRRGEIEPSRLEEARVAAAEALAVHRAGTNRFELAWSLHLVGMIDVKSGRFADAAAAFREAAQIFIADNDLSSYNNWYCEHSSCRC